MGSMSIKCTRCNEDIDWPRSLRHTLCDWCTRVMQGKETDNIVVAALRQLPVAPEPLMEKPIREAYSDTPMAPKKKPRKRRKKKG